MTLTAFSSPHGASYPFSRVSRALLFMLIAVLQGPVAAASANGKINTFYGQAKRFNCALGPVRSLALAMAARAVTSPAPLTWPVHFARHKLFDLIESENELAKCRKQSLLECQPLGHVLTPGLGQARLALTQCSAHTCVENVKLTALNSSCQCKLAVNQADLANDSNYAEQIINVAWIDIHVI